MIEWFRYRAWEAWRALNIIEMGDSKDKEYYLEIYRNRIIEHSNAIKKLLRGD